MLIEHMIDNDELTSKDNIIIMTSYILTILVGLTLGIIIGYYSFKTFIYKGPDSNIISKNVYVDSDGKKYKWVPKVCICPLNYSMIKLKDPEYFDPNH